MALPTSGQLTFSQINVELGNGSTSEASMFAMATSASISTSNVGVADFYGYSHDSISVSTAFNNVYEGNTYYNYITSSGAWTAVKSGIASYNISSFTSSGAGNLTINMQTQGYFPVSGSCLITYTLTGTALTTTWTFNCIQ